MRRKPETSRRRSTAGRSLRAARVCICATLASGTSASKTSSAMTTRLAGSSSAAQQDSRVVLPEPGAPANTIERSARTHSARKRATGLGEHVALDELVERAEGDPGEPADVDHGVAAAADVAVHDVQAGAVVELGVLQAFGRVELAVARRRVVEQLGEGAGEVLAVVEDLVVVARGADVALHEDGRRRVDHDLPDVPVVEQGSERPVAGQVAERPLGHLVGRGQVEGAQAALEVVAPPVDLVGDERLQAAVAVGAGHVVGEVLGPALHPAARSRRAG